MNKHFFHSVLVGLIVALLFAAPALGFENPRESPPGTSAQTGLTASPDGTKFGIGTYNFLERFNLALGSLFQGKLINPKVKGSVTDLPAAAKNIVVKGNYAYVALNAAGNSSNALRIIDISNPAGPANIFSSVIAGLPGGNVVGMSISGPYLYLVFSCTLECKSVSFRVINISDPANPIVTGGSNLGTDNNMPDKSPLGVYVSGRYAYVIFSATDPGSRFRIIDISDPSNPRAVAGSSTALNVNAKNLYVSGGYAYLTLNSTNPNFAVIDVSNPSSLSITETNLGLASMNAVDVHISGRYAYVTFSNASDPFRVVDLYADLDGSGSGTVRGPLALDRGTLNLPAAAGNDTQSSGRYVYLTFNAGGANILRIIDARDPLTPLVVGGENFNSGSALTNPAVMAVSGRYGYLAGSNWVFQVADISGLESVSVSAHSLGAGFLKVFGDTTVRNNLQVRGGLTVGRTALFNKSLAVKGDLRVVGNFYANGVKQFFIDHPLFPLTKNLSHAAVESPERKNLYDGTALLNENGEAAINLPNYFESLNRDFRYQLSPVDGTAMPNLYIAGEVKNNSFRIAGGRPFGKVSWQVTGIRNDAWARANPLKVEEYKLTQ